jgi:hypothetical protein
VSGVPGVGPGHVLADGHEVDAQLDLLPVVIYEPDALPVVIMVSVNYDLRRAVVLGHAAPPPVRPRR